MTSEANSTPLFDRSELVADAVQALDESARKRDRWLVAFSGGADSLALFLTVLTLWPEQRPQLVAAHFNHGLRGGDSDADEKFCEKITGEHGIAFTNGRWNNPGFKASEADARAARFDFFSKIARERDCRVLLTGHHLNDVLETMLMRLARGASSAGLAAPRPVRVWSDVVIEDNPAISRVIVRPLLATTAEEIRSRLSARAQSWREDASNQGGDFFRNRVRLNVVPLWLQAAGPTAFGGVALTRAWLEEDDAALESWLDQLGIQKAVTQLPLAALRDKPRALRRRALRRWRWSQDLSRVGFEALMQLLERGEGRMSVGDGHAVIEDGQLRWEKNPEVRIIARGSVTVALPAVISLPDGACIHIKQLGSPTDWCARLTSKTVDPQTEALLALPISTSVSEPPITFTIRFWESGDRFAPLGLGGSSKLQDLFVNRKINSDARHSLPLICGPDGQIVWVPGFPPAEHCRIRTDSVSGVQLTYIPGTSTVS